jgi:formamidopyrimidine-DNA glycosylase
MPELPEAECVRQSLHPRIVGRKLGRTRVLTPKLARPNPKALARGLAGRTVEGSSRHGKLIILELSGGAYWTIHLGMTGQVIMADRKPRVKHIHITFSFSDHGPRLYFRDMRMFGAVTFCPDRAALESGPLANMGPDALGISAQTLLERLAGRKAPMKSLLLDQRILAGVGNIYADEALHRAGLSPLAKPAELSEADLLGLHRSLGRILRQALARGGSSVRNFVDAEGRAGTFQHAHRVYRRTGQPCPACGQAIERITLAGRSTHFCPQCQKRGAPGPDA